MIRDRQDTIIVQSRRDVPGATRRLIKRPPARLGIDDNFVEDTGEGRGLGNGRDMGDGMDECGECGLVQVERDFFDVLIRDERGGNDGCPLALVVCGVSTESRRWEKHEPSSFKTGLASIAHSAWISSSVFAGSTSM